MNIYIKCLLNATIKKESKTNAAIERIIECNVFTNPFYTQFYTQFYNKTKMLTKSINVSPMCVHCKLHKIHNNTQLLNVLTELNFLLRQLPR